MTRFLLGGFCLLVLLVTPVVGHADDTPPVLSETIRTDIEALRYLDTPSIDLRLTNLKSITEFYTRNNFNAVWLNKNSLKPRAINFLNRLETVKNHGLNPDRYLYDQLVEHFPENTLPDEIISIPIEDRSELEFLMTEALFRAARDFRYGLIDPAEHLENVEFERNGMDHVKYFRDHLEDDRLVESLFDLLPQHRHYRKLVEAHKKYLRIVEESGGWPRIPSGETLRIGMSSDLVRILKQRLWYEGYWNLVRGKPRSVYNQFDTDLMEAVERYQRDRGIPPDGVVGRKTREALNVPTYERLERIQLNLERWRWLSRRLGSRYVWVNIANFDIRVISESETVFSSRAIVGRTYRQTPLFSDRISYLVFNPTWILPLTVVRDDLYPEVRDNPGYLRERNIKVYSGWSPESEEVNPGSIDWSFIETDRLPYRFVQQPGPENSLGRVKFMFPNKYDVYLHDTPHKNLFESEKRNFSSGCIRVEDALGLVRELSGLSDRSVENLLKRYRNQSYHLKEKVPVHILYLTTWVSDEGRLQFRDDIYDRDRRLAEVLLNGQGE